MAIVTARGTVSVVTFLGSFSEAVGGDKDGACVTGADLE